MPTRYWYVILTYILMQLSGILGFPLVKSFGITDPNQVVATWSLISFPLALVIISLILKPDIRKDLRADHPMSTGDSVRWGILGIFMAFAAQTISGLIEMYVLNIPPQSENTQMLTSIAETMPIFILVIALIAPILEEIVFRKVLFGTFRKYTNFFLSALVSSVIFALVHQEPEHVLKYAAMGFVFAYLYEKTKRIIVPILAHMTMNLLVVLLQFFVDVEQLEQQYEALQTIIFGG